MRRRIVVRSLLSSAQMKLAMKSLCTMPVRLRRPHERAVGVADPALIKQADCVAHGTGGWFGNGAESLGSVGDAGITADMFEMVKIS